MHHRTGFKIMFSLWDYIKFKLRLFDWDDTKGLYYVYLFSVKIFFIEFARMRYVLDGKIYKRKINYRRG